ncbi:DapH/DapD/GlmU-related protein [Vibrio cyclitrophicus]
MVLKKFIRLLHFFEIIKKYMLGLWHFKLLKKAKIEQNVRVFVGKGANILGPSIEIEGNFNVGMNAWIETVESYKGMKYNPSLKIKKGFEAKNNFHVAAANKVIIGEDVLIGSNVLISDHAHGVYNGNGQSCPIQPPIDRELSVGQIVIGNNVWIGDGVCIAGCCRIGNGAVIGANSVVTRDVEENTIVVGNPARKIKRWNCKKNGWESVKISEVI